MTLDNWMVTQEDVFSCLCLLWKSFGVYLGHIHNRLPWVVLFIIISVPLGLHHFPYQNFSFLCQVCGVVIQWWASTWPHRQTWNFFTHLSFPEREDGIWVFLVATSISVGLCKAFRMRGLMSGSFQGKSFCNRWTPVSKFIWTLTRMHRSWVTSVSYMLCPFGGLQLRNEESVRWGVVDGNK